MSAFDPASLFAAGRSFSGWPRLPSISREGMVATSHPRATGAGVRALEAGGNAVDAALAAAAMLSVCEPGHNSIGGDAFALLWWNGELLGLNGSGRAPARLDGDTIDLYGPRSVTVPGAVRAWADLAARFGTAGLAAAVAPAAEAAAHGVVATARVADRWRQMRERAPWPAPRAGEVYRLPALAATLRRIAEEGPDAFYLGSVADAIAGSSWLEQSDLAAHHSDWVEPLRRPYRNVEVCELPPNGQGATALVALAILEELDLGLHGEIEAVKLALDWASRTICDGPFELPDIDALRARIRPDAVVEAELWPSSNTTYLCAVDRDRNAISLIQSTYHHFGSGVLAGNTGIVLQNRAAGFREEKGHPNSLAPGKRPFHTIIPAMLLRDGGLLGPFGVMGGPMQAQAHVQVVRHVVDGGLDPQGALDAPRFRFTGGRRVSVEPGLGPLADGLRARGHDVSVEPEPHEFGVGQMILTFEEGLIAGSDGRADGYAAGT
jgi:gamma-glutamyltranspeptidase/glutathione hydrolase